MLKWLQFSYLINIVMSCFYSLRCKTYTLYALQIFPNKCCRQSGSLQWWLVAMTHSSMSWVWRRGRRWWWWRWSWTWWLWWQMGMKTIHSSIEKRWCGELMMKARLKRRRHWDRKNLDNQNVWSVISRWRRWSRERASLTHVYLRRDANLWFIIFND